VPSFSAGVRQLCLLAKLCLVAQSAGCGRSKAPIATPGRKSEIRWTGIRAPVSVSTQRTHAWLSTTISEITTVSLILSISKSRTDSPIRAATVMSTPVTVSIYVLFHDLVLRSYFYRRVWSVITAHNLTPEKRNNYLPHSITPTSCLRNNIQLITGILPCCECL